MSPAPIRVALTTRRARSWLREFSAVMLFRRLICFLVIFCASARLAPGIILFDTGDPQRNTATPGDNSGWQFQGQFGGFLGTPIAPRFFITANHIGGAVGQSFSFHGETFTTVATFPDPTSDLRIWQVDHDFRTYAPLYRDTAGGNSETGRELRVFGRGTQRGGDITLDGTLRGWAWGGGDGVQRWGSNTVAAVFASDGADYLLAGFDSPAAGGVANEAHLSVGDSGGAVFILEDGLWKLAAINLGVDELYTAPDNATQFVAAIFDARGYYTKDESGSFVQIPAAGPPVPTSFYSTRIAARLAWIQGVTGAVPATLPAENFADWLRAYFTPAQIAAPTITDPTADADSDGIPNLLEFAFNLDPTFAERATLTAGAGLRGLPLIRVETLAPSNESRLTVEFVRRTAASGAGLTYSVQFADSLAPGGGGTWQASNGSEAVTSINARWERVKVTDSVAAIGGGEGQSRLARVVVMQASP